MPTLFPPDYPERPDAPLLAFGPSFSEEIARSVIQTIPRGEHDDPREFDIRVAAGLTMLEAFHPRDQLECMMAAQGVAFHCAIMESLRRALLYDQPELVAIKLRSNASQLARSFSTTLRDLERRQAKPLPPRPGQEPTPPEASGSPDDKPNPPSPAKRGRAKEAAARDPAPPDAPIPSPPNLDDIPDMPEDVKTRPDGTPGSLSGYISEPPVEEFVPREPPIMIALATLPKPWRMVNASGDQVPATPAPEAPPESLATRGPLDLTERMFKGDELARFASARLDPNAPIEPPRFEHEDSVVELELVSTGGDPELEARRQAMMAAHPEGKPIVVYRHGAQPAPEEPEEAPDPPADPVPPDT